MEIENNLEKTVTIEMIHPDFIGASRDAQEKHIEALKTRGYHCLIIEKKLLKAKISCPVGKDGQIDSKHPHCDATVNLVHYLGYVPTPEGTDQLAACGAINPALVDYLLYQYGECLRKHGIAAIRQQTN